MEDFLTMGFELKTHRVEVDVIEDDQGITNTYKHYMTVLFDGFEADILITRNEVTGDTCYYYIEADGSESETTDEDTYQVGVWMEKVAGQPLDIEDGWDALPKV